MCYQITYEISPLDDGRENMSSHQLLDDMLEKEDGKGTTTTTTGLFSSWPTKDEGHESLSLSSNPKRSRSSMTTTSSNTEEPVCPSMFPADSLDKKSSVTTTSIAATSTKAATDCSDGELAPSMEQDYSMDASSSSSSETNNTIDHSRKRQRRGLVRSKGYISDLNLLGGTDEDDVAEASCLATTTTSLSSAFSSYNNLLSLDSSFDEFVYHPHCPQDTVSLQEEGKMQPGKLQGHASSRAFDVLLDGLHL